MVPGWKTTEFWGTVATSIVSLIVAIAALFGHDLSGSSDQLQGMISTAGLLGAGIVWSFYSHSRGTVKAAALTASPTPILTDTAHTDAISSAVVPTPAGESTTVQPGVQPAPQG